VVGQASIRQCTQGACQGWGTMRSRLPVNGREACNMALMTRNGTGGSRRAPWPRVEFVGTRVEPQPPKLWAYADSTDAGIGGNRTGLAKLAETLNRGAGRLHLEAPTFGAHGVLAMSSIEITACDGLIVVSSSGDVLRVEGDSTRLREVIAGTIENMLRAPDGAFMHAHLEPREYQGFARSSSSLVISKE
jgi:hypothetical protein